ncbi:MAG: hypothetical protein WC428_00635 [Candidatus Paceibacterota bacterium]|jgi:hypothetical protein
MKCCKVYCTYFGNRRGKFTASPANATEALIVFKKNIEHDLTFECGVDNMDIIIVNNHADTITKECCEYLENLNNSETKFGKIFVVERENIGASMGAYSYAFDKFGNNYDYWLFIEDDLKIIYPNYYKMIIDEFANENENLGFLSLTLINEENNPAIAFVSGGFGATKKEILEKVKAKYGKLPYDEGMGIGTYAQIGFSEVMFTNCYYKMGYKVRIPNNTDFITLADNWEEFPPNVKWQNIKKFDLTKKFFMHVGI